MSRKAQPLATTSNQSEGLRALRVPSEGLPDLCHHAEYRIYVDGQYVESIGNVGRNAARALEFYRRKRRKQTVEIKIQRCRMPACTWGKS